jgi:PHD/YefM family antitoxin component YafN of YafNO toxin-antitoxin module
MSNQRIIYQTENGGVAVLIPASEYLKDHTIEEIAEKDVPTGVEYKIVDVSEIPSDRTFRSAWEYQV